MSWNTVRTIVRRFLMGGGALLLLVSLLAGYAQVTIISDSGFANRATATLDYQGVRSALSQLIVSRLLTQSSARAQTAQPLVEQATGTVLGSTAFRNLFHGVLLHTHRAVLSERNNEIALNLSRAGAVVTAVLARADPKLASTLGPASARLRQVSQSNALLPVIRALNKVRVIEILAPVASVLCFLLAIALAGDRRRELRNVGIAIAVPCAAVWVLLVLGEWISPWFAGGLLSDALPGIVEALLGDLRRWCLILAVAGISLVAIANASGRPLDLPALGDRVRSWFTAPDGGSARFAVLGTSVAVLGVLIVLEPLAAFRFLLLVVGGMAVYWGVYEVLRLVAAPSTARASPQPTMPRDGAVGASRWSAVAVVAFVVALLWVRNIWNV